MILCSLFLHVADPIVLGFSFPLDGRSESMLESRGGPALSAGGGGVVMSVAVRAPRVHVFSGLPLRWS